MQRRDALERGPRIHRRGERGAALIVVVLLTLALSAIAMTALRTATRSLDQTGSYKMGQQASEASRSALTFVGVRAGDRPSNYLGRMRAGAQVNYGASRSAEQVERGGVVTLTEADFQGGGGAAVLGSAGSETGLFGSAANPSHESDPGLGRVGFEVILRDASEGPPPVGSDSSFCSKKLYMGARSSYDARARDATNIEIESNWDRPPRSATSLQGLESWIGPVPCDGAGSN